MGKLKSIHSSENFLIESPIVASLNLTLFENEIVILKFLVRNQSLTMKVLKVKD